MKTAMRRRARALLALSLVLDYGVASADSGLVVVGGTANEHTRVAAGAAIEAAAREAGWTLASKRLSKKESERLLQCNEPTPYTCVPATLAASGIHHVLVVTADNETSDTGVPQVVLSGRLIVTSSRDLFVNRRYCEHCADDRLAEESTLLAQEMLRLLATQSGRTVLEIKSVPAAAQIVLDGQRIGVTDANFNTFPGLHVVLIEKDGYLSGTARVMVEEGKTERVMIRLEESPISPIAKPIKPRPSRLVPGGLIGLGSTAILGGILLYAVDEDPSLTGGKQYWDTAPSGVGIGVAGVMALGAGIYLWRRMSRSDSMPTLAITSTEIALGWARGF